jgi:carboxymethylenebutenolidase
MTDLGRYIVEEWAEEYQHGRLSRREFLRRIAVFAGSASLSIPVLASLGYAVSSEEVVDAAASVPPARVPAAAPLVSPEDPDVDAGTVSFPGEGFSVLGYLATPRGTRRSPGILVVHENRGLTDHFKDVPRRFAKVGYAALAVDLASPAGGTEKFADLAEVTALLGRTPPSDLVAMLNAGVRYLQGLPAVQSDRVGTVGFCFGGGMVWRLITQNADLRAAVPFYGPNPPLADVPKIRAAVLALYGALDERIGAGIPAIREALEKAGVAHEIVIYPGADHAFFNDTGSRYNEAAAKNAWARTLAWFGRYLSA